MGFVGKGLACFTICETRCHCASVVQKNLSASLCLGVLVVQKNNIMHRIAFKMKLFSGFEAEYKKRHDQIFPELKQLLKEYGISDYSIFLDETTNSLFAVFKAEDPTRLANLPSNLIMQKWWKYMADIMETHPDNSPVQIPLQEVFYLP